MAKKYMIMPHAEFDLKEISLYISRDSIAAASKVRAEFRRTFHHLAENPYSGHLRKDLTDKPIRFWSLYSYMVIYKAETNPIEIIRVISNYRDIPNII